MIIYVGVLGPRYVGVLGPRYVGVLGPDPAHHLDYVDHLDHVSNTRAEPAYVGDCLGSGAFRFAGVVTACPRRARKLAELREFGWTLPALLDQDAMP